MTDETLTQVLPEHKGLAFIITKSYKKDMSAEALYEATRGVWKDVPEHDASFLYAFATCKGIVKEVYEIEQWEKAGTKPYTMVSHADTNLTNRWEFVGHVAPESVRSLYIGKKIVRSYGSPFKKVGG
ncbi:hypothetical protein [Spirosoma rhododendri]|uniref:Uncharacterized protein n=1 Tax=Spirosoma rhododendri TaxID=2728024 RepID=A0A7L5DIQ6_9BACT|nr:hypothetical protein [Spirosoma rhododendri]QJD77271.1 hypothetical protein HH216_01665 [Spirosoma rhododendri]